MQDLDKGVLDSLQVLGNSRGLLLRRLSPFPATTTSPRQHRRHPQRSARAHPPAGAALTYAPTPWSHAARGTVPDDRTVMRRTNLFRMVAATVATTLIATAAATSVAHAAGAPVGAAASDFAPAATNLAQGRPTQESGHADVYDSSKVVDGNRAATGRASTTRSPSGCRSTSARRSPHQQGRAEAADLRLGRPDRRRCACRAAPPGRRSPISSRSQTYTFNPASGSTVTINFSATSTRYVRVAITANSGWPAGQLSELEVYGSRAPPRTPPRRACRATCRTPSRAPTISLNWVASTDNRRQRHRRLRHLPQRHFLS